MRDGPIAGLGHFLQQILQLIRRRPRIVHIILGARARPVRE